MSEIDLLWRKLFRARKSHGVNSFFYGENYSTAGRRFVVEIIFWRRLAARKLRRRWSSAARANLTVQLVYQIMLRWLDRDFKKIKERPGFCLGKLAIYPGHNRMSAGRTIIAKKK
jgi:hypothetical protein